MKAAAMALAVLWLALALPHIATRYSYDWDSSQFERGAEHFDIAKNQPHAPGYPLWIVAIRALAWVAGRVNAAQVTLALAFTMAGIAMFFLLAREMLGLRAGLAATAAVAFSPVVSVHAMVPLTYAVDFFVSAAVGWLAARLWMGRIRWAPAAFAVAAIAAGFRPSGATFLAPLLAAALWRSWRKHPGYAAAGVAIGAACWLAWYLPTAWVSGGIHRLAALDRAQFLSAVGSTSVFFGAPGRVHAGMIVEVALYFALALIGLALPLAIALMRPKQVGGVLPGWATPAFFAWWLAPNLAMILLLHCPKPGYILLSLPPVALRAARWAQPILDRWQTLAAVAAVGLAASYLPYERFTNPAAPTVVYQWLRGSPRLAILAEKSQREIRRLIDDLPGPAEEKMIYCLREWTEAPNLRTVTYEYRDVNWAGFQGGEWQVYSAGGGTMRAHISASAWLCDGAGMRPEMRARFPQARRVAGNALYSWWISGPQPAQAPASSGVTGPDLRFHKLFPLVAREFKVISSLHVQPIFRSGGEVPSQAKGGFSRDGALSRDNRANAVCGYAEIRGEPIHADSQVVQGFL